MKKTLIGLSILFSLIAPLLSQQTTVQISSDSTLFNQYPYIFIADDGKIWITYVSDGTCLIGGYYENNNWETQFLLKPPKGFSQYEDQIVETSIDETQKFWLIYYDSTSRINVGFIEPGDSWVQVDSTSFRRSHTQFGVLSHSSQGVWYYWRTNNLTVHAKHAIGTSIINEKDIVVDPEIAIYEQGTSWIIGAITNSINDIVTTFYHGYNPGLLGGNWCEVSIVQYNQPQKLVFLENGFWEPYSQDDSLTTPITIGNSDTYSLVLTKFEKTNTPTSYNAFLLDTNLVKEWVGVIRNVETESTFDPRMRYQISASHDSEIEAISWLSNDTLYTKALIDTTFFVSEPIMETLSDSTRRNPKVAVGQDSTIWITFEAMKDNKNQIFLTRISPRFIVDTTVVTSIDKFKNHKNVSKLSLDQNYPNPFNFETTIEFYIPSTANIKLDIFNVLGQKVRTLFSGRAATGDHQMNWDGRDDAGREVTSGIYIYRLKAYDFVSAKKMVLLK